MSRHIAYYDCFSGASGDMLLGALVDAGLPLAELEADLRGLALPEYHLHAAKRTDHGITGTKLDVVVSSGERPARHLATVRALIEGASLPEDVVRDSLAVFERLAQVEAGIHGTTVEEVHFHEIGAVDALVDIVGFCAGIHRLGIEAIYASALPVGRGTVRTEHGILPVPAPATLALLASVGAPIIPSAGAGEMVTPTGAAILSTLAQFSQPPMCVRQVGYGFGSKRFPWANLVRVWIGDGDAPNGAAPDRHDHPHGHMQAADHRDHEHHEHPHDHTHQPRRDPETQ